MKKLFFAALFAVVAIGGAVAADSNKSNFTEYYLLDGTPIDCVELASNSCSDITVYDKPANDPTRMVVDAGDTFYNP